MMTDIQRAAPVSRTARQSEISPKEIAFTAAPAAASGAAISEWEATKGETLTAGVGGGARAEGGTAKPKPQGRETNLYGFRR